MSFSQPISKCLHRDFCRASNARPMIKYLPLVVGVICTHNIEKNETHINQLNWNEHCKAALHAIESICLIFGDIVYEHTLN